MRIPFFGGTADGDADKNMILCDQFFVSPSDSLAMIELGIHKESWNVCWTNIAAEHAAFEEKCRHIILAVTVFSLSYIFSVVRPSEVS